MELKSLPKWRHEDTSRPVRPTRIRFLRMLALCSVLALLCKTWLSRSTVLAAAPLATLSLWKTADHDPETHSQMQSWRVSEATKSPQYWFTELNSTVSTMQFSYWNGSCWPDAIQWVGAALNTLLVSTTTSLGAELVNSPPDTFNRHTIVPQEVWETRRSLAWYFTHIRTYYGAEDTVQIFDAAYDDAQWVVLEWLAAIRVYQPSIEMPGPAGDLIRSDIAAFAHRARIFYAVVQDQFDTSLCNGGVTWNPSLATYKNAITNELFVSSSIAMYLYFPGDNDTNPYPSPDYFSLTNVTLPTLPIAYAQDSTFLNNAIDGYAWFRSHNFTNAQGLIVDGFHISTNQSTCDERNEMVYTYNQGVILSGLRGLWEATGDASYLVDGYSLVATVINATGWYADNAMQAAQWAGLGRNGIMEDYCDAPATCSQDAQIFKGIYFEHLDLFCEPLPTSVPLVPGVTYTADAKLASTHLSNCLNYLPWIEHNAQAALRTRNESGDIGGWWGGSFVNHSQTAAPYWATALPAGSWDVRNQPWVLDRPPWVCRDQSCQRNRSQTRTNQRGASNRIGLPWTTSRDYNDAGRGRTVETQGSGLGVVKAANDFSYRSRRRTL